MTKKELLGSASHRPISSAARRPLGPITVGLASALMAGEGIARAQTTEEAALPPISVTGEQYVPYRREAPSLTKLPGTLQKTPQSVSVVPQEVIEQQGSPRLRDALRNVPGITLNAGEGGAQGDVFTLRGFSGRSDFFLDGIRDPGSYTRDAFNVEAIEVLKGPSSVLFGRGSTGGVVNQVSKVPRLTPGNEAAIGLGTNKMVRSTADLNHPLSERMAVRLNAMAERSDVAGRDEVENKRWGVAPSIGIGIGGQTEFTLKYLHQEEDNIPDYGVPFVFGRPAPVSRKNFYGLPDDDREKTVVDIVTARLRHDFNETVSVANTFRYGNYDRDLLATAPRAGSPAPGTPTQNITVNRSRVTRDGADSVLVNQTDVTLNFTTGQVGHTLVAGLELGRETFDRKGYAFTAIPPANLRNPDTDVDTSAVMRRLSSDTEARAYTVGVYALDRIKLSDKWEVIGGLRWDRYDAEYEDKLGGNKFDRVDRMLSTRAAVVYSPTERQSYYVSYGTSFNPSAEFLGLSATTVNLEPEENRTYEAGAKLTLMEGVLDLRGAIFRIEKTNARTPDPSNASVQVLEGEQHVNGFELEAVGNITRHWSVLAGYAFLDSEIDSSGNPAEVGKQLASTPKHSANIWTNYDFGNGFRVGTGLFYVGKRYANNTNTNKVSDYVRWDASLGYEVGRFAFQLNAFNLTDEKYYEGLYTAHAVPGAGRSVLLTTAVKF